MWDKIRKEPLKYSNLTMMRKKRKRLSDKRKEEFFSQLTSRESFSEYESKYSKHRMYENKMELQ